MNNFLCLHGIDGAGKSSVLKYMKEEMSLTFDSSCWSTFRHMARVPGISEDKDAGVVLNSLPPKSRAAAVDVVVDQSKELFGINNKDMELYLVGNSLGGVVVTCLTDYFKLTKGIVLAGSGTRTVFRSELTEKQILNNASKFKGKVMLIQGSKDDVVPLEAGDALLSGYKNAQTRKEVIEGANHQFSKINGKNMVKARQEYIDRVVNFFFY